MEAFLENKAWILAFLLGLSECLALIPSCKTNGILQGFINILKALKDSELPVKK